MRRTLLGTLAALTLLASTACTVTQKDPDYVPPAPLPPLEQLTQAPLTDAAKYAAARTSSASRPRTGTWSAR